MNILKRAIYLFEWWDTYIVRYISHTNIYIYTCPGISASALFISHPMWKKDVAEISTIFQEII